MDKLFQRFHSTLTAEINALHKTKALVRKHNVIIAISKLLGATPQARIITTGVGKCAPIAEKMAQTLMSYGIDSFFLHPTDALHGNLGGIKEYDLFVIFSKSGNTPELLTLFEMLPKSYRILITENDESKLLTWSTTLLQIHVDNEGDPHNLAPMASTTVMLAVADGLCSALIEATGKTPADFAANHPGGTLGKRLLCTVEDLMETDPEYIPTIDLYEYGGQPEPLNFGELLTAFSVSRYGAVFILRDEKLWGIFTDGDLRRYLKKGNIGFPIPIKDITHPARATTKDTLAIDALKEMERESKITVMPVVDTDNRLIGVIHIHELIGAGIM